MDVGEVQPVTAGQCRDVYVLETGMFDVTGYGGVYLLDAERPAIVETGTGRSDASILDALGTLDIHPDDVEVIAVTHVHLDHAGGAGALVDACENATVVVHERGAPHLIDPARLVEGTKRAVGDQWRYYDDPLPIPDDRVRAVRDGDVIDLGDHELSVIEAPGHAHHQVVYHDPTIAAVFTGDAAGIWVPGREVVTASSPPPNFDLEQAVDDLDRIEQCDPETLLFTHFGPGAYTPSFPETYERALRDWVTAVERKRASVDDDQAVIKHFVERARFADVWSPERARAETRLNVNGVLTYLDRGNA